jgi:MFS family permease
MLVAATDKVGRAIGTNAVFGNIGISGAAVLAGVLTEEFGWRAAFMVPGALSLAVGAAFVLLAPPEPRGGGLKRSQGPAIGRRTMVRAFVVVAVGTFAMGLASNVLSVAVPKLFAERLGDALSLKTIGLLTTGAFLFGSIAQFTVGRAIDRFGIRRSYLPLTFFMVPAYALTAVLAGPGLFPAVAVAAMTTFGTVTVNDSMVARYTGEKWRARAYAVRYLVGFGASAAAVQFVAVMHERSGFTGVFVTLAVVSAIVLATALFTPREEAAAVGRAQAARPAPAE